MACLEVLIQGYSFRERKNTLHAREYASYSTISRRSNPFVVIVPRASFVSLYLRFCDVCLICSASRTSPKALRVDTVEAEAPLKPGPGVGASSPPSSGSMNSFSNYISSDAKTRQHALSDTGSVLVSTNWKERSPSKNNSLLGPCPEEHAVQDAASPPSSLLETHDRTSFSNARKGYTPTKERGVLEDEVVTAPRTGDTPGAAVGSDQALRDVWTGLANEARPPVHEEHEEAGRVHQPGSGPDAPIARNNFDVDESRSPNAGAGAKAKLIFSR